MRIIQRVLLIVTIGFCTNSLQAQDRATYADGSRPQILINWDSFEDVGFPSSWKTPFTNIVINGYTRVNRLAGIDVRPQFRNYITGRTNSNPGEIVISANQAHSNSFRSASTFGQEPDRLHIVFHRNSGATMTPWNFTPYFPKNGEMSMYGVFMHELLHALGVNHNTQAERTIMNATYRSSSHFGPWEYDIASLRALYPLRRADRLRLMGSTDGGTSFSSRSTTVERLNAHDATTTHPPSIAADQNDGSYILSWTTADKRLSWVRTDGTSAEGWSTLGGSPEVSFGSSMTAGDDDTWLWAFVRVVGDERRLTVLRSRDDGVSWGYAPSPSVETFARPALARTRVGDTEAWVLAWSEFNTTNSDDGGRVMVSISTNDGSSWSSPKAINDFYRAQDGVALDCNGDGDCLLGFSWAGHEGFEYGQNRLRYLRARVDTNNRKLLYQGYCYPTAHSRVAPGLAHDSNGAQFITGVRNQNYRTSISSMRADVGDCPTSKTNIANSDSHVGPDLAGSSRNGEMALWFAKD